MKLRGIDFGNILGASGVQGFFGEGYWFHPFYRMMYRGFSFRGMTFVAKTVTVHPRKGNIRPWQLFPPCIVTSFRHRVILNAVGLRNKGIVRMLQQKEWQKRTEPFFLSFMAVGQDNETDDTSKKRLDRTRMFADVLGAHKDDFAALFGLQVNFSCPNAGVDPSKIIDEALQSLDALSTLKIPFMAKFNVVVPSRAIQKIAEHPSCDAICVSNTIPWKDLADAQKKLLSKDGESPLKKYGGGGLSGRPLLPLVAEWVYRARDVGITKPINAGGGVLCPYDVDILHSAGASSMFLGSVAVLSPDRVQGIIKRANELNWR